jgi:hypothetical protein
MDHQIRSRFRRIMSAFGPPWAFWTLVAVAGGCAVFLLSQHILPCDDAYITFRHVKNLSDHGRMAWNLQGDPVLGSTTPGFILALTAFRGIFQIDEIDQAALYLNSGLQFFVVVLTYLIAIDLLRRPIPALLVAFLVGINGVNVYVYSEGFESAMLVVILLAGLYFVRLGWDSFAAGLASFAPLVRPEGILLTPLVWGYLIFKGRPRTKPFLFYLPIPLLWIVASIAYYGSPIPHPIHAKKKFPSIYAPYTGEDVSLIRRFPGVLSYAADVWRSPAGALLYAGAADPDPETTIQACRWWLMFLGLPLGLVAIALRPSGGAVSWAYPLMFLLFYGWIGYTRPWYFPSFVTFSILTLFCAWIRGLDLVRTALNRRPSARWATAGLHNLFPLLLFLVFLSANNYSVNRGQYDHEHRGRVFPPHPWGTMWDLWEVQRFHHYRSAAEYLNTHAVQPASVLVSEVGFLGYFYVGDVFDSVGLCTPEALQFYPPPEWDIRDPQGKLYTAANNFVPTNMVLTLKPTYVVNARLYIRNLLRPGSSFLSEYEEVTRLGRVWGEPVVIYRRRDLQASQKADQMFDTLSFPFGIESAPDRFRKEFMSAFVGMSVVRVDQ